MNKTDIYVIMATPAWLGEVRAALTARRILLQGANIATVAARDGCLRKGEELEARRLDESMIENDSSMETIEEILGHIDATVEQEKSG